MSSVLTRQYLNVASLVLLVYDQIITWDREVNHIWRSSGDRVLKIMFFLGRYWALAFQIINLVVTHPYVLKKKAIHCHMWFGFQNCAVCVGLVNLQLLLMLRVYALYERSTRIAAFLICWFAFYTVVAFWSSRKAILLLQLDSSCMLLEAPHAGPIISFCVVCIVDQCILWGLTANKYRNATRHGLSTNPVLRLVMRDTSCSCLVISSLFIAMMPYSLTANRIAHIVYWSLLCSLVSVLTCRTILNMRGLSSSEGTLSIDVTTIDLELTDPTHLE